MEYEIILGQMNSDVYKEKNLILQNSTPEDPEYKNVKEKKMKITCLLEIRLKFTASLNNCNIKVRDELCSLKSTS